MNPNHLHTLTISRSRFRLRLLRRLLFSCLCLLAAGTGAVYATSRVSTGSGSFSQSSSWNPAGVPGPSDDIIIQNGHTLTVDNTSQAGTLTIANGGKLDFVAGKKLSVTGNITVFGSVEVTEAELDLLTPGATFMIGATGTFTWDPSNNTAAGASLFLNGSEYFHPTSNLIIKKWYNYASVPIGSVISGSFGNLTLSTLTGGLLYEWNQNNQFEHHPVLGTLTIDQGWIVLDKSGSISNTTIGSIYLNNINSYLDFHSGHHPASFTVTTSSLTNIGGTLNGLYNGNGNIRLQINGDFTNLGNTALIFNSGIPGTGNGNATLKVTGKTLQTTGDFRGIFNLSSTNSGNVNLELNDVQLKGGIFMGQYACHTAGNSATIRIRGDLEIDYATANAKFRGLGLTALSGTNSNLQMQLIVEGDLLVKGTTQAEFTSSGSTGPETTQILGTSRFEGCTSNFNFGSHSTTLTMNGDVYVTGGTLYLSRTGGSLTALINGGFNLQFGNATITGGTGNSNLVINGDYHQTGGSFFFHNNPTQATPNIIYATVQGDFLNQSGAIHFDNNSSSTAQHRLSLNGSLFTISGNASFHTSVSATNPMYGIIYYDSQGTLLYHNNRNTGSLVNTKQVVNANCTLEIATGDFLVSESVKPENDMLLITAAGVMDAGNQQIFAGRMSQHASVKVADGGRLRLSNAAGLYNGTVSSTIASAGNMVYTLGEESIVEYYGSARQIITGLGLGNATTMGQQYGILEINKPNNRALLNSNQVYVRKRLQLELGELDLSGFNITVNNGLPSAITAANGYIRSEGNAGGNSGMVIWKNINPGEHTVPFGHEGKLRIPFRFTPLSGAGNTFAVSTRGTYADNRPLTSGVTHLNVDGTEAGTDKIIDRWYHVSAPGITADITVGYTGSENTTRDVYANGKFTLIGWSSGNWKQLGGDNTGVTEGTGSVTANQVKTWGPILIAANQKIIPADLLSFQAKLNQNRVDLTWTAMPNVSPVKYTVERSEQPYGFTDILEKTALPPSASPISYEDTDPEPLAGISYYRLRQLESDGSFKYSNTVKIENTKHTSSTVEILSVMPNPFSTGFTVTYHVPYDSGIQLKLVSAGGQLVYGKSLQNKAGKNSFEFTEDEKLVTGIYILTLSNGKSTTNYKLFHL